MTHEHDSPDFWDDCEECNPPEPSAWTRERPTTPGWTGWVFWPQPQFGWQRGDPRPCVVGPRGGFWVVGEGDDSLFGVMEGALFAGPITPPPLPKEIP